MYCPRGVKPGWGFSGLELPELFPPEEPPELLPPELLPPELFPPELLPPELLPPEEFPPEEPPELFPPEELPPELPPPEELPPELLPPPEPFPPELPEEPPLEEPLPLFSSGVPLPPEVPEEEPPLSGEGLPEPLSWEGLLSPEEGREGLSGSCWVWEEAEDPGAGVRSRGGSLPMSIMAQARERAAVAAEAFRRAPFFRKWNFIFMFLSWGVPRPAGEGAVKMVPAPAPPPQGQIAGSAVTPSQPGRTSRLRRDCKNPDLLL